MENATGLWCARFNLSGSFCMKIASHSRMHISSRSNTDKACQFKHNNQRSYQDWH